VVFCSDKLQFCSRLPPLNFSICPSGGGPSGGANHITSARGERGPGAQPQKSGAAGSGGKAIRGRSSLWRSAENRRPEQGTENRENGNWKLCKKWTSQKDRKGLLLNRIGGAAKEERHGLQEQRLQAQRSTTHHTPILDATTANTHNSDSYNHTASAPATKVDFRSPCRVGKEGLVLQRQL
jgi:hypothetical protein